MSRFAGEAQRELKHSAALRRRNSLQHVAALSVRRLELGSSLLLSMRCQASHLNMLSRPVPQPPSPTAGPLGRLFTRRASRKDDTSRSIFRSTRGRTAGRLVGGLVGALVGELVGALVGELVGGLVGGLVGATPLWPHTDPRIALSSSPPVPPLRRRGSLTPLHAHPPSHPPPHPPSHTSPTPCPTPLLARLRSAIPTNGGGASGAVAEDLDPTQQRRRRCGARCGAAGVPGPTRPPHTRPPHTHASMHKPPTPK